MSDLESDIRSLNLRAPGDSLDARVLAALQATDSVPDLPQEALKPAQVDETSRSFQSSRKGVVVTSGWIVASASMLTGILIGRMMPPVTPPHDGQSLITTAQQLTENRSGEGGLSQPDASDNSATLRNPTTSVAVGSSIGSQIVESIWLSPAAAALVWEQQTGQIFNVVTHVGDRRFDMCRDCHRIGG